MILAIDIGNTNIAVGGIENDRILFKERLFTDQKMTAVEYAISLKNILELNGVDQRELQGGIVSSSVPTVTAAVRTAVEKMIGGAVLEVGPGVKTGLDIKIDNPAQLGADLVVGAVAGIHEYGAPLILVDMGTATSITVVNDKGQVIGGMIMPGVGISLDALSQKTSYLPKISIEPPKKFIGSNTIDCMKSGVLYGAAASIDGMVERIWEELGHETPVVATGRMSKRIVPFCKEKILIDDELLFKGLKLVYDRSCAANSKKRD